MFLRNRVTYQTVLQVGIFVALIGVAATARAAAPQPGDVDTTNSRVYMLVGATGLVSLGHAAFFGVAGYVVALLAPDRNAGATLWTSLPLAVAVSALLALAIGALALRTRGVYFIMVTLAFSQMVYFVFHDTKLAGGSDGAAAKQAMERYWRPALESFKPQMILISAGFDAHREDLLGGLALVEDDYAWLTRELMTVAADHAQKRVVSMLEGGYHLPALGRSAVAHVRTLAEL